MIRSNETIASIIYNQEVVRSRKFDMLCHLHCQFDTRVWATWYAPGLGSIIKALTEDLLKFENILLDTQIFLPS